MIHRIALLLIFLSSPAFALDASTRWAFWDHIAPLGPSLYCGDDVTDMRAADRHSIEHVYPLSWMRLTLGCWGAACNSIPAFVRFDNDMHNLWPADRSINSARGNRAFADLTPTDSWREGTCDFRSRGGRASATVDFEGWVEPRTEAKGPIARAILYVHHVYRGLLPDDQHETAARWHKEFPTTELECLRAEVIYELQGSLNPFLECIDPR